MTLWPLAFGAGVGASLMALMDPRTGSSRRARVRKHLGSAAHTTGHVVGAASRDAGNRLRGLVASRRTPTDVPDEVLVDRVRARLGHLVRQASAVHVSAANRVMRLAGWVHEDELARLLRAVAGIPGVESIEHHLSTRPTVRDGEESWPAPEDHLELAQPNWPAVLRLMAGVVGLQFVLNGFRRRTVPAGGLGLLGLGLVVRAATNMPVTRLVGVATGLEEIRVQHTVAIDAPIERVFEFWINYRNFPQFMSHVLDVQDRGYDQSHWKVAGPAGIPVEWDAVLTELTEREVLAWKTVPGSIVQHAGVVRFSPLPGRRTQVHVLLTYNPGAGAVGHAVATLFRADPRRQLREDLGRVKTLLEGRPSAGQSTAVAMPEAG